MKNLSASAKCLCRMLLSGKVINISPIIFILLTLDAGAKDLLVSGTITDMSGSVVPNARVSMYTGNHEYYAISGTDGYYSFRVTGTEEIPEQFEIGRPYPNPFSFSVNVPLSIKSSGDVRFMVYSFSGQKIKDIIYHDVFPGSYNIIWDGCGDNGAAVSPGIYIYAVTFKGRTWSSKIIKTVGYTGFSSPSTLEPISLPPVIPKVRYALASLTLPVITSVNCTGYFPLRITDIVVRKDTIIDFTLGTMEEVPYRAKSDHIEMFTESGYRPLMLKGINLGAATPGTFPGEIAYAIPAEMYESWIELIGEAGFNSIRTYTLHPPVFYEKLANYNSRHPHNPILLFQGIWLDEVENGADPDQWDLIKREPAFTEGIREMIDCMHGNKNIDFRPGRAYGNYQTDMSQWTAAYIIGREISPHEIEMTNTANPSLTSYPGDQFSISSAAPSDVFATSMLDETASFEYDHYGIIRPVSISSWPTLDPLTHPTEIYTDEDKESIDIVKIDRSASLAGLFASYHAYPYYPNFISEQPSYRSFSDAEGPDSYLGYLNDLKAHYGDIPLVIAEFGVPSSWGSAHQSFSSMDHGGYSEIQQGEKNMRLMHNIIDAGCAGGFMFSWMDEWFKPTWIVQYLEAYGFLSEGVTIPTRQLWHNLTSPEQNFGLISFTQDDVLPFVSYHTNVSDGPLADIGATNDNSYLYLEIQTDQPVEAGDTMLVAFDTYSSDLGESRLTNGKIISNRAEFMLRIVAGQDSALHFVTQAYDMYGLTPRFNLSDPVKQKYRSTVTDGAPWDLMQWVNDEYLETTQDIGKLPSEHSSGFSAGSRSAVAWNGSLVKIRIPWTLLYFRDPTRMTVIDGAVSSDGGYTFTIQTAQSDGIALSVYYKGTVTSTTDRYNWENWLVVPPTSPREKGSLQVIRDGLQLIPGFAD